jgi:glutathione S-transferase
MVDYELYYWPSIQGRGEFVRLAFEAAGVRYVDVARLPENKGGGTKAILRVLEGSDGLHPFAPPILKTEGRLLAQTPHILAFLGPRLGLVPDDEQSRLDALQIQLTIADFLVEVHDVHHPIASSLYYEDQKKEASRRARIFLDERVPKYLRWLERALARNGESKHLIGKELTYVDLSAFQIMVGLAYAFPRAMAKVESTVPLLVALRDNVASHRRVAAYLGSPRRIPFNEDGLFRHYPELDKA